MSQKIKITIEQLEPLLKQQQALTIDVAAFCITNTELREAIKDGKAAGQIMRDQMSQVKISFPNDFNILKQYNSD